MDEDQREAGEEAAIALMRAGNHRGAEARLRTLLAANPNDARALALLAQCRFKDKDKKAGLEIARSAAALRPDDPLVKSTLLHALQRAGKDKTARDEQLDLAESAAADNPQDSDTLFDLAIARQNSNAYRKARGRKQLDMFVDARDLVDDAERFAREAHELINVAYLRLGEWNYEAAASLAQRAMVLDPTLPDPFRILAECALAQKQPAEAYDLALEALRLDPGDKRIMRVMIRARARRNPLLRPVAPVIDWMVEMDRAGLVVVPLLVAVLGAMFAVSVTYDLERLAEGEAPAIILSLAIGAAVVIAVTSYITAIWSRWRIRRDLRKLSLPDF